MRVCVRERERERERERDHHSDMLLPYYSGDSIYQPPEWIQNKKCHARSLTVWMLGLLLYFMLHGSLPFDEPDSILYSLPSLGSQLSPGRNIGCPKNSLSSARINCFQYIFYSSV